MRKSRTQTTREWQECEAAWKKLQEKHLAVTTNKKPWAEGIVLSAEQQRKFDVLKGIWPYDLFWMGFFAGLEFAQKQVQP